MTCCCIRAGCVGRQTVQTVQNAVAVDEAIVAALVVAAVGGAVGGAAGAAVGGAVDEADAVALVIPIVGAANVSD